MSGSRVSVNESRCIIPALFILVAIILGGIILLFHVFRSLLS